VLQLKSAYRDGTTHIVMSAQEFMQRLAALVPRPRLHLIRFPACWPLTPNCVLRSCRIQGRRQANPQKTTRTANRRA